MKSLIKCLSDKENIFYTNPNKNKIFIRTGYDINNKEIFNTIYFDRKKFIEKFKKD